MTRKVHRTWDNTGFNLLLNYINKAEHANFSYNELAQFLTFLDAIVFDDQIQLANFESNEVLARREQSQLKLTQEFDIPNKFFSGFDLQRSEVTRAAMNASQKILENYIRSKLTGNNPVWLQSIVYGFNETPLNELGPDGNNNGSLNPLTLRNDAFHSIVSGEDFSQEKKADCIGQYIEKRDGIAQIMLLQNDELREELIRTYQQNPWSKAGSAKLAGALRAIVNTQYYSSSGVDESTGMIVNIPAASRVDLIRKADRDVRQAIFNLFKEKLKVTDPDFYDVDLRVFEEIAKEMKISSYSVSAEIYARHASEGGLGVSKMIERALEFREKFADIRKDVAEFDAAAAELTAEAGSIHTKTVELELKKRTILDRYESFPKYSGFQKYLSSFGRSICSFAESIHKNPEKDYFGFSYQRSLLKIDPSQKKAILGFKKLMTLIASNEKFIQKKRNDIVFECASIKNIPK